MATRLTDGTRVGRLVGEMVAAGAVRVPRRKQAR